MPNINLRDNRKRDAEVRAEHVGQFSEVRYIDQAGEPVRMYKVLKATMEHSLDQLVRSAGAIDKVGQAIVDSDADVDIERVGMFLTGTSRVYVNEKGEMVHNIAQTEIVRSVTGEERERRPRQRAEPNVDAEIPINWTGRLIKKDEAVRRFVFSSKLQIAHINGLTYDFLYSMAKELADTQSLMLLGAGKSGRDPLIFRRGMTPHRGFLEGRIDGDKYILLLHLSKLELKKPEPIAVVETATVATTATTVAVPAHPTADQTPAVTHAPAPMAAVAAIDAPVADLEPQKPTVADVIGGPVTPSAEAPANARRELQETVATAKAKATRKRQGAVTADPATKETAAASGEAQAAEVAPSPKKRAPRAKASEPKSAN